MDNITRVAPAEASKTPESAKTDRPATNLKVRSASKRGAHTLTGR